MRCRELYAKIADRVGGSNRGNLGEKLKIFCLDCNAVRDMGVHGECGTCGSRATDTLDRITPMPIKTPTQEVRELERLWKRGDS